MLFYRAAVDLSPQTLKYVAGMIRRLWAPETRPLGLTLSWCSRSGGHDRCSWRRGGFT